MGIPLRQSIKIGTYLARQKLARRDKFPLIVELEPLFACNLACNGCGKIQYPTEVLRQRLSVEQAVAAIEESRAPMVSIAGGEPLLHPEIDRMTRALARPGPVRLPVHQRPAVGAQARPVHPSPPLQLGGAHRRPAGTPRRVGQPGRHLRQGGGGHPGRSGQGLQGHDQHHLLQHRFAQDGPRGARLPQRRARRRPDDDLSRATPTRRRPIRSTSSAPTGRPTCSPRPSRDGRRKQWRLNHSPLFLDFLEGKVDFECTPWGIPSYSVFGWQRPCYLMADGYTETYQELLDTTDWSKYGRGKDPRCANCMAHCGYEPSAVLATTRSLRESLRAAVQS